MLVGEVLMTHVETGRRGEALAAAYLTGHGYRVVARNWRCAHGEIDIVAEDLDGTAVVVEVKTRHGTDPDDALAAIDEAKLTRLHTLGQAWVESRDEPGRQVRVDAIGIVLGPGGTSALRHIEAVF